MNWLEIYPAGLLTVSKSIVGKTSSTRGKIPTLTVTYGVGAAMGRRAKWKPLELFKSNSEPKAALCLGKLCQLVLPGEAVSVREYTQCVPPRLTYSGTTVKHSLGQWQ